MNRFKLLPLLLFAFVFNNSWAMESLWTPMQFSERTATAAAHASGHAYRLNSTNLRQLLSRAGLEGRSDSGTEITLPVANGEMQRFSIAESPIMAPGLAARYPDIKTYKVLGLDDPHASGRLSISPKGFHGMVSTLDGVIYIDPQADNSYRSVERKSQMPAQPFSCGIEEHSHDTLARRTEPRYSLRTPGNLRVYRLAVAGTAEYVAAVGPTVQAAQNEIVVAINRVNEIYERDLGIRLQLVANNDQLLYTDAATDPYTNNDGLAMLDENQTNIDNVIGAANYDIGHVFSTGGGGIAQVGAVCSSLKAQGVTGLNNPVGDLFYIDFVAHEMGHQFSAEHSFNGTTNSCLDGRVASNAFEPGSGSTIMAYAGICGAENIASRSDALFHAGSIGQIDSYTTTGNGNSCGTLLPISNPTEPVINAGSNYLIPHKTPFVLTAQGSDTDPLLYTWDQMNAGAATDTNTLGTDLTTNSLFRSYLPRSENYRHFPALGTTLQNKFDDSEVLACQTRTMTFRATVRDGRSGMDHDDVVVSVDNSTGPFSVTSFNTSQSVSSGSSQTITWDVAGTNGSPVNCNQVDISLLTFNLSKTTYAETLLAGNVSNDGSATIVLPSQSSSRARIKVQCSNNIFYDISDADLDISGGVPFPSSGKTVFYNTYTQVLFDTPAETCIPGSSPPPANNPSGGGGGLMSTWWILSLCSLFALRFRAWVFG